MNNLSTAHCIKVTFGSPSLEETEIDQFMSDLLGWDKRILDGELSVEKKYKFKDFRQAMAFANQIARLADEEDHHPALLIEWGKVTVNWWTHASKGFTRNDFIMAAKTELLYADDFAL